jgi:hypothetical protein
MKSFYEVEMSDEERKKKVVKMVVVRLRLVFLLKMNLLPTRLRADTSKPFRVSFSHFPFV